MPKNFPDMLFPNMKRAKQWNEYYCGPAVLEMLASIYGLNLQQDKIVFAAEVQDRIRANGMLVCELGLAINRLAPEYKLWMKQDAVISELSTLINTYKLPVGVEWQGLFDDFDEEEVEDEGYENGDDDAGHYGVVTGISTAENWVTMADPYMNKGVDRQFTVLEFERRWWDINEIINPLNGKRRQMDDYHVMFVVVPKDDATPELFGMESF